MKQQPFWIRELIQYYSHNYTDESLLFHFDLQIPSRYPLMEKHNIVEAAEDG